MRRRFASEQLERVLERGLQDRVAVAATSGGAGQVHDERAPANAGEPAREESVRRLRDRVGTDRLGDPRRGALEHGYRCLGRDVAETEAGSAGREDEVRPVVGEAGNGVGDRVALVGNHPPDDVVAVAGEELHEQVAAPVLPLALGDAVGDGEDGGSHSTGAFVFSTSCTSPTTMSLSIALAMS